MNAIKNVEPKQVVEEKKEPTKDPLQIQHEESIHNDFDDSELPKLTKNLLSQQEQDMLITELLNAREEEKAAEQQQSASVSKPAKAEVKEQVKTIDKTATVLASNLKNKELAMDLIKAKKTSEPNEQTHQVAKKQKKNHRTHNKQKTETKKVEKKMSEHTKSEQ